MSDSYIGPKSFYGSGIFILDENEFTLKTGVKYLEEEVGLKRIDALKYLKLLKKEAEIAYHGIT
jgi:hypothetical protein